MKNLSLLSKRIVLVFIALFFLLTTAFSSASAFSNYEKDISERLYSDLNQEYKITEFKEESLEYQTLKRLEAKIIKNKFKNENFKVHHIDDQLINAYYIGAGNIMLFEGLLQELNTEDQLAGLIAHEMGHAVEEHLTEDLERNIGLTILNILFNHFTENQYQTMTNTAQNLIANGYSREQEQESDIYAVDLMLRSGYDPVGLVELMKIFKENSHNIKLLEFTQTHPIPESRIEYLEEYIAEQKSKLKSKTKTNTENLDGQKVNKEVKTKFKTTNFDNEYIYFSYPQAWKLNEAKTLKREIKFRYKLEAQAAAGEIMLEDLSTKRFMETTEKQYKFAAIEAEENGFRVQKSNLSNNKLNIYQLHLSREDELRLKYFISEKNREQMLKLSFELINNKPQQQILINEIIKSIEFK